MKYDNEFLFLTTKVGYTCNRVGVVNASSYHWRTFNQSVHSEIPIKIVLVQQWFNKYLYYVNWINFVTTLNVLQNGCNITCGILIKSGTISFCMDYWPYWILSCVLTSWSTHLLQNKIQYSTSVSYVARCR